jgi:hypothetical protein
MALHITGTRTRLSIPLPQLEMRRLPPPLTQRVVLLKHFGMRALQQMMVQIPQVSQMVIYFGVITISTSPGLLEESPYRAV